MSTSSGRRTTYSNMQRCMRNFLSRRGGHGPANRQAVHEDSDTSLLGGFDVKANLYLYLYTLWHAVVVIETRCELVSDCKPHVGMPTSASAIAERTPSSSPNGHANPLRAQHHGSLGGFKVKANLQFIYLYT